MVTDTDLLDEYCELQFGHADWEMDWKSGNLIVTFFSKPRPDYITEENEND